MSSKKIIAIFSGANGSMGYETGKQYSLKVTGLDKWNENEIRIERDSKHPSEENNGCCDYGSIIAFLNNWDCIRNA